MKFMAANERFQKAPGEAAGYNWAHAALEGLSEMEVSEQPPSCLLPH